MPMAVLANPILGTIVPKVAALPGDEASTMLMALLADPILKTIGSSMTALPVELTI